MHKPPYIIYCNQAMAVYQALGIEKKRIDKGQDWRFYGERGLAHQQVTVWVYEGTLKLEHQAVTLSKYRVEW